MLKCPNNASATQDLHDTLTKLLLNPKYKHAMHQIYTILDSHSLPYWYQTLWPNTITRFTQTNTTAEPVRHNYKHLHQNMIKFKNLEEENIPGETKS